MGTDLAPFDSRRLMLFDLRGSGRRRMVKIVYVTLAILMGGGLVLFGIGGSGALSGGLLDAITESSGTGDDGTDRLVAHRSSRPRRRRAQDPTAATPWAAVARARFNLANLRRQRRPGHGQLHRRRAPSSCAPPAARGRRVSSSRCQIPTRASRASWSRRTRRSAISTRQTSAQEIIAEDRNSAGAYAHARPGRLRGRPDAQGRPRRPTRRSSSPTPTCGRR